MEAPEIIGRDAFKSILDDALGSPKASLGTVYGRRWVGKTYFVKTYLSACMNFQYQGIHNVTSAVQLDKFTKALSAQLNGGKVLPMPVDWFDAVDLLAALSKKKWSKRLVIVIDEFPWMHTPKSNF